MGERHTCQFLMDSLAVPASKSRMESKPIPEKRSLKIHLQESIPFDPQVHQREHNPPKQLSFAQELGHLRKYAMSLLMVMILQRADLEALIHFESHLPHCL